MRYQNTHKKHFKKYLVPEQQRLRNKWEELHHPPQCGMERPCFLDGSTIWKHRYTPICSWARDCISTPVGSIYVMGTQAGCGLSCMAFARSWADIKLGLEGGLVDEMLTAKAQGLEFGFSQPHSCQAWWYLPGTQALWRQRQMNLRVSPGISDKLKWQAPGSVTACLKNKNCSNRGRHPKSNPGPQKIIHR